LRIRNARRREHNWPFIKWARCDVAASLA